MLKCGYNIYMKMKIYFMIIVFIIFSGYKISSEDNINDNEIPHEQDVIILSDDEISIIDEAINHIVTFELGRSMDNLQICLMDTFYVNMPIDPNGYENNLRNQIYYLNRQFMIDENIILAFIDNNLLRKKVDRNANFISDVFWIGEKPTKPYIPMLFSSIGFNQNKTGALIYVFVNMYNWAFAEYIYLEKENGIWIFKKCVDSWRT